MQAQAQDLLNHGRGLKLYRSRETFLRDQLERELMQQSGVRHTVLDAQQALFGQQRRYVDNKGFAIRSLISVYKALGGGWQGGTDPFVDEATRIEMQERTDWGELLEADRSNISEQ